MRQHTADVLAHDFAAAQPESEHTTQVLPKTAHTSAVWYIASWTRKTRFRIDFDTPPDTLGGGAEYIVLSRAAQGMGKAVLGNKSLVQRA